MHPEVISEQPSHCPECGMKLLPSHLVAEASGHHDHEHHDHPHSSPTQATPPANHSRSTRASRSPTPSKPTIKRSAATPCDAASREGSITPLVCGW
ncbi:MAG: heavy metal-binding domain-containing protein [Solirubrobacteraceae bacterium]